MADRPSEPSSDEGAGAGRSRGWPGSRRSRFLWAVAGAAVIGAVVAGVLVARGGGPAQPVAVGGVKVASRPGQLQEEAGRAVPELSGTNPITGKPVSLSDFKGKPVVINIWASWCPPCRAEAPDIKRFVDAHPEAVMLGIDLQDNPGDAKAFYREFGWTHPSIDDPSAKLATKLGLIGLPTTIFLSTEHREVARVVGETNLKGLEQGLKLATSAT